MAIVQISRITQRKGLETDLPQPLAGAEFGWAIDQRRLFIGNGTLADGAPVVGNTEVLTEFSDILSFATEYTYKGDAAGYTVQTGATSGTPVQQSLQTRLDSYAVITDFGATGDGVTDVTADINRALYQLYCRELNPQIRRSLFFPAGTYIITDTLNIPPYCSLYGEGIDSTIIYFYVQTWTNTVAYAEGVLVKDGSDYYRSQAAVPIGTNINNATYWTLESLPEYIARTADSNQQVGVNIGVGGALPPGSLDISGIRFVTNQSNDGFLVEDAAQCTFTNVGIEGPLTTTDLTTATADIAAVRWASTASLVCRNVTWNNCVFTGFTYGTNTQQQIEGVTFSNCNFDTLHQGVVLGGASPVLGGPTGVRIVQNTFDNIYAQGVVFDDVSLNATAYNTFYDVGNHFNGATLPASSIIDINANNNVSIGDMFQRNNAQSVLYPRIALNDTDTIALSQNVSGIAIYQDDVQTNTIGNSLDLGTYQMVSGVNDVLTDNATATLFSVTNATIAAFKMNYTIARSSNVRIGTLTVVCANGGVGFNYTDDYTENGDTGITLTPSDSGTAVTVSYTATSTTVDGTINYSIVNLGLGV